MFVSTVDNICKCGLRSPSGALVITYDMDFPTLFPTGGTSEFEAVLVENLGDVMGDTTTPDFISVSHGSVVVRVSFLDPTLQTALVGTTRADWTVSFAGYELVATKVCSGSSCESADAGASSGSEDDSSATTGAVVAVIVVLLLVVLVVIVFQRRARRNSAKESPHRSGPGSVEQIELSTLQNSAYDGDDATGDEMGAVYDSSRVPQKRASVVSFSNEDVGSMVETSLSDVVPAVVVPAEPVQPRRVSNAGLLADDPSDGYLSTLGADRPTSMVEVPLAIQLSDAGTDFRVISVRRSNRLEPTSAKPDDAEAPRSAEVDGNRVSVTPTCYVGHDVAEDSAPSGEAVMVRDGEGAVNRVGYDSNGVHDYATTADVCPSIKSAPSPPLPGANANAKDPRSAETYDSPANVNPEAHCVEAIYSEADELVGDAIYEDVAAQAFQKGTLERVDAVYSEVDELVGDAMYEDVAAQAFPKGTLERKMQLGADGALRLVSVRRTNPLGPTTTPAVGTMPAMDDHEYEYAEMRGEERHAHSDDLRAETNNCV